MTREKTHAIEASGQSVSPVELEERYENFSGQLSDLREGQR